jgi:hypothetical protein
MTVVEKRIGKSHAILALPQEDRQGPCSECRLAIRNYGSEHWYFCKLLRDRRVSKLIEAEGCIFCNARFPRLIRFFWKLREPMEKGYGFLYRQNQNILARLARLKKK